jgi:imidazolonepropionase-like amidohydrolase
MERGRAVLLLCWLLLVAGEAAASDLVIRDARLIDGTGAEPRAGVSILVRGARVEEIGADVAVPAGAQVIDAEGGSVIPGLIDAHVHLFSVPGSSIRGENEAHKRTQRRRQLRAYVANGVTSVLDTGIGFEHLEEIRGWLAAGEPGPRVFALGPPLSAPGGYADDRPASYQFGFSVPDEAAAAQRIARLSEARTDGVKVKIEKGFGSFPVWPTHEPGVRHAIRDAAAAADLPVYIHAFSEDEQSIALDMSPHAFVHAGFIEGAPSEEHVRRLADSGIWVISTLSILDSARVTVDPHPLDAPHVRLTVPEAQRATAADPSAQSEFGWELARMSWPGWIPDGVLRFLLATFPSLSALSVDPSLAAVGRFHAAGVPIVMGSDSGNWEIIPYEFHGPTSVREVELLASAGLTPMEALEASTRVPAEMLGVADEIGTVEVGKRADLVILREDPLADLTALTRPRFVVRDGEARDPEGWMATHPRRAPPRN